MADKACVVCKVVPIIAAIGAINWGLVGLANLNLVEQLFGIGTTLTKVVYIVVGISGLGVLAGLLKLCPCTKK